MQFEHRLRQDAALADLYRRACRYSEARDAFERALMLAQQEPERRFLCKRLKELEAVRES